MTNYREILRIQSLGLNNSQIADACGYSRTTVIKALELARANHLSYHCRRGFRQAVGGGAVSRERRKA